MNEKLERLLSEYEKVKPITNDAELIEALEQLLSVENSRSIEKMDVELINEIVELLLMLQNVDLEKLDEHSRLITEEYLEKLREENTDRKVIPKKAKTIGRKWILPLVAVLSLMMITSIVAFAFGTDIASMSTEFFKDLKDKLWYESVDNKIIKTDEYTEYYSFEKFLEDNDIADQILLPYGLFDEIKVNRIRVSNYGNYKRVLIAFQMYEGQGELQIEIPNQSNYDFSDKTTAIYDFDVYHYSFDNQHQGLLMFEKNLYTITVPSYNIMETIIYNLEVSNEPNN